MAAEPRHAQARAALAEARGRTSQAVRTLRRAGAALARAAEDLDTVTHVRVEDEADVQQVLALTREALHRQGPVDVVFVTDGSRSQHRP